jgi:type VI secretion system secreted protein VgrG
MAKLTKTTIYIGSKEIKQFSELSLTQGIFAHHSFRLVCPADVFEKPSEAPFEGSKTLIGEPCKIHIKNFEEQGADLQFVGLVTQIDATKFNGYIGDIIISGYSPTIVMDGAPTCKTWEKKPLEKIISDVCSLFPENQIKVSVKPNKKDAIGYTVQYKETAWQYMSRLAAKYGEWLFYNGNNIVFGHYEQQTAELIFGSNLNDFSISMQLRPVGFAHMSYDYHNAKVYTGVPQGVPTLAGLNDLGKFAYEKSEAFFTYKPKSYNEHFVTNKTQLTNAVNTIAAAQSSNMVRFTGSSSHFGVQLGNKVTISGNQGHYKIIEVNHYCDGRGHYSNSFIAIPDSILVPPVTQYAEPQCETQTAVVVDNHDKAGLGRIKVRLHWMDNNEVTPWLRVCSPHGGGDKGMFFAPEKGEEVVIGFENDKPEQPFVLGAVQHGKAKHSYSNAGNDVKAIQTRSGNKILLNDKDGSFYMSDKGGANTMMDGAGNIVTNANNNSTLNAGNKTSIHVGGKKNAPPQALVTMDAAGNIVIDGKTSITIRVGGNEITISKEGITTTAKEGDITTSAAVGTLSMNSASNMTISTDADLGISGGPNAVITSGNTNIM